ncbi:MAG: hypothetical protein ACOZNI_30760 [Myxococcota bacterium]
MRIALVCTAHGFGHLTRQLAIGRELVARRASPTVFTAATLVEDPLPRVTWAVDVGLAQRDSLREDLDRTRVLLEERCSERAIDAIAAALAPYDVVVADTAPTALEAARRAGVRAVAVGNFDWAWIYGHYPALADWATRFAAWQAPHEGLELWPGPGLRGFRHVERVGLVARPGAGERVAGRVLVSFGGFGLDGLADWLPRIAGVRWLLAPPMPRIEREDCDWAEGVRFPDLVARAQVVLTKPGYGIFAECAAAGTRIVWLDRGSFPEAPFMEAAMLARGDVKVVGRDVSTAIREALARPMPTPVVADGAGRVAARLLREAGGTPSPRKPA